MRRVLLTAAVAAVVVGSAGTALAVTGSASSSSPVFTGCITMGTRTLVNVHEHDASLKCKTGETRVSWSQTGPVGAMGAKGATGPTGRQGPAGPSGVISTNTTSVGSDNQTIATGGSFVTNSTQVGTLDLKAGTYVLSLNAKATPSTSNNFGVFPEFFVYNQTANADFTGDLFNVGSGSLAENNTNIDSYFSGSTVLTFDTDTTLHIYAFGYDSDRSASSYTLDSLSVSATQINPGN